MTLGASFFPLPADSVGRSFSGSVISSSEAGKRPNAHQQKRERQAHQLPVSSHGYVVPDLVVAPSQSVLDLLVAVLHPHPQTVEPDHLSDARGGEITLNFP